MANSNVNVLQTVIQFRRGTEEQWNLVKDTFIPREGEPCTTIYEDGSEALIKIGDGKRTWGELVYTRDSFVVFFEKTETETEEGTLVTTDTTLEELIIAEGNSKILMAFLIGEGPSDFNFLLPLTVFGPSVVFSSNGMTIKLNVSNNKWYLTVNNLMETSAKHSDNFDAQNKSIVNLKDSEELASAVTKQYTDFSTPTFIYLEEENGVIQSKTTDINMLSNILVLQTYGYELKENPLYKAIKCYAILDGNCYDLVYSSLYDTQEPGKTSIIKRTFYAITSDGLNKLSVLIDENQKVTWTKEAQGVASEQFVVTVTKVGEHDIWESDKTPAEIKTAVEAGKQVVLKTVRGNDSSATGFLVNIVDNIASFCLRTPFSEEFTGTNLPFLRTWYFIASDKTVEEVVDANFPVVVDKDASGKYTSTSSPRLVALVISQGGTGNVFLMTENGGLSGTIVVEGDITHLYFPDYAKNKIYDLKWNKDENPSTYTFTELPLDEKPMIVTITDDMSDKTPAEIAAAAQAGKQVILQETIDNVAHFYYFVNADNDIATFCEVGQVMEGTADLDPIFARIWCFIRNDKTIIITSDFNLPFFTIEKDASGKYTSDLNPELLMSAAYSGSAGNVFLSKDDETFIGTIYIDAENGLHIYFPDYAKNKVYDLKYNDDTPVTYTFTELSLGEELFTVNITKDPDTQQPVADKTYAEIVAAMEAGKKVQAYDSFSGLHDYSSQCKYKPGATITFAFFDINGDKDKEFSQLIMRTYAISESNQLDYTWGNLATPYGLPFFREKNKILKTDENGAMKYVDADTYLVKQSTSSESGLFLSINGNGKQEWANPLTAGNSDSVVIKSSTPNSTKKFRITVDDAGAISATEVVS